MHMYVYVPVYSQAGLHVNSCTHICVGASVNTNTSTDLLVSMLIHLYTFWETNTSSMCMMVNVPERLL